MIFGIFLIGAVILGAGLLMLIRVFPPSEARRCLWCCC
jgi:hypothetical protein